MNFEDEPYVRVYKRRTTTMAVVGWQARAVLRELFLIVDRAGVLDLDDEKPADAVAALLGDVPVEVVEESLAKLEKKGCIIINNVTKRDGMVRCLVIPKFREAQETPASDKLRAKESRERRRSDALSNGTVTECDNESQDVTQPSQAVTCGHAESRAVTQCSAVQCSTEIEAPTIGIDILSGPDLPIDPKPAKKSRDLRSVLAPDDFKPNATTLKKAEELNTDWAKHWEKLRLWSLGSNKKKVDWQATLQKCMISNCEDRPGIYPINRNGSHQTPLFSRGDDDGCPAV